MRLTRITPAAPPRFLHRLNNYPTLPPHPCLSLPPPLPIHFHIRPDRGVQQRKPLRPCDRASPTKFVPTPTDQRKLLLHRHPPRPTLRPCLLLLSPFSPPTLQPPPLRFFSPPPPSLPPQATSLYRPINFPSSPPLLFRLRRRHCRGRHRLTPT